ncbi:MAG: hypothetical protein E7774_14375 [Bradyrhizobium sp.]|nr:MAG: hypothetical protein E7774_14375 [Bradyrhizobium sp.]
MPETAEPAPIACALDIGSFQRRSDWIADLNRHALRMSVRDDLRLTLAYDPSAVHDVRRMVEAERICCAFLDFEVSERADVIAVTITAPEGAREAAEALFAPFALQSERKPDAAASTCGCDSESR